ncbi:MAG TPA: thiamine-phosphate kinase [Pirellulales bacterium]|jgi:thiamine-monophosphate kinase|nr:thiamine-phosphate kinase [Pirellulales bacterium]
MAPNVQNSFEAKLVAVMESDFIAWLRSRLPPHPQLRLGPGDDAAILELGRSGECVVTVDLLSDGVDFDLATIDARRAGRKALAASLSDLAAMAAKPVAAVIALALPRKGGQRLAIELYEGMIPLAERYATAIAGGDTNSWDGPLAISVTAIGEVTPHGPLLRGGAKPGDRIIVTGEFGGSILGKHLDFEPRVNEALLLKARFDLHAGMDCSDGLSLDLSRMAGESGCGAALNLDRIPIAAAAHDVARQEPSAGTALDRALGDGEDFELILAAPPEDAAKLIAEQPLAPLRLTDIGQFIVELGLWQVAADGQLCALQVRGYEHAFD